MKKLIALISCLLISAACPRAAEPTNLSVRTYTINRKVSDFPTNEDLSTPQAAYATINRAMVAEGDAAFPHLSIPEVASTMPPVPPKAMLADETKEWLNAEILEVGIYCETNAGVFAEVRFGKEERIDVRWLTRENGRWLNKWHDSVGTLDEARELFSDRCALAEARMRLASRPPVANPQEYLRPFVEFLRREVTDPKTFLLQALANHLLVILGEVHHRPRYWNFYSSLVRDKAFGKRVGVIYMELPGNGQASVDQFLTATNYDPQPIIETFRDLMFEGWPDEAELEFFKTVWEVNQGLPREQRLRIVLPDMQRPWERITERSDWEKYDVDRDKLMADDILRDLKEHAVDRRHALFIVGYEHAAENVTFDVVNPTFDAVEPWKSAGWRLREKLGTNVFTVFPHSPVVANDGQVNGRIALGLFESAFLMLTNRPMAFPLEHGPFGEQIYYASMDEIGAGLFLDNFQAYLYLGPFEDETVSPMIPGFYTDNFVKEEDRRSRIMYGKGLVALGVKRLDAASFIEWMKQDIFPYGYFWGQPFSTWSARYLGPLSAWELGSDWKQKMVAAKLKNWQQDKVAIRKNALRLFDALRQANYEHPGYYLSFPAPDVEYQAATDSSWMRWICQHFCTNPIVAVDLGKVTMDTNGLPAIPYCVSLKNGEKLKGVLPMNYNPGSRQWYGVKGLDWQSAGTVGQ